MIENNRPFYVRLTVLKRTVGRSKQQFRPFEENMNAPAPPNDPSAPVSSDSTSDPKAETEAEASETPATEPPKICLDQFLKTCGVETGGQAKRLIQGGEVLVNNEVETRRRKKLVPGDEVQLYDDVFVVALAEQVESAETESTDENLTPPPENN